MARGAAQLSPMKFRKLSKIEGLHSDGGNLFLQVSRGKRGRLNRSWIFRFAANGRARDMGLGSFDTLSLAEAREVAKRCRQLRLEGIDPIEHRRARLAAAALEAVKAKTFDECRDAYFREHSGKWTPKHAAQWLTTVRTFISPKLGKLLVKDITTAMVIGALEPIWKTKPETASRTRGRVEAILDWAAVSGFRSGDNPARWELLGKRFASRSALDPVRHYPALPYAEIGAFMNDLRARTDVSARALEFVILTASRSAEGVALCFQGGNAMKRRTFLKGAIAAAVAPPVARAQVKSATRVLKFVPEADVTVLDPVLTTVNVTRFHALMIWDQLYGIDRDLRPHPQMVEGHTVEDDGKRWTFRLREGLRFHDGEPVRGRDCIASIRRWAARDSLGQALMARVAEMSAPEDRVFVIRLHRPFRLILDALAKGPPPALCIMPERLASTDPYQPIKEMIGSGPFKWVADERIVGARAVYERYADYRPREDGITDCLSGPKIVNFDRVIWHVMPDAGTALAALQTGEVDWWQLPPNDLVPLLEQTRAVVTERIALQGGIGTGIFNCLHPPFDKAAVRRVVLQAVSQADYMNAVAGTDETLWRDGVGIYAPGTPMATDVGIEILTGKRDMPRLRVALRDAGYRDERVVLLAPSDSAIPLALGEVGNDLLRQLGMNVDYVVSDFGTLVQRRANKEPPSQGGWSMFHTAWPGIDMIYPVSMQVLRANGDKAWFGWPDLPQLQTLVEQWTDAPDPDTQRRIAAEIQMEVFNQVPFLPLGQFFNKTAHRRDIEGILKNVVAFWNVRRS